jgi:excisionase family DNA binding protein
MKKSAIKLKHVAQKVGRSQALPAHWLTREQIARRYQVSIRSVDYWIEDRRLPHYRLGRLVRFDPAECDVALRAFHIPARACQN